jgi:hypothetical protein
MTRHRWISIGLVSALSVLGAAGYAAASAPTGSPAGSASDVQALVAASVKIKALTATTQSQIASSGANFAGNYFQLPDGCLTATACVFGETTSSKTLVAYGDSHIRMWLAPLITIATANHLKLVIVGHAGCPAAAVTLPGGAYNACAGYRATSEALIKTLKPAAILIGNRTSYPAFKGTDAQWGAGLQSTLTNLAPAGATIAIMGDIQVFSVTLPDCLTIHANGLALCAAKNPNKAIPGHEAGEAAVAKADHLLYVDPTSWLCTATLCSPVIGDYLPYSDSQHVAVPYSRYLTTVLQSALAPLISAATR